jgi:hypothetical protein
LLVHLNPIWFKYEYKNHFFMNPSGGNRSHEPTVSKGRQGDMKYGAAVRNLPNEKGLASPAADSDTFHHECEANRKGYSQ